MLLLLLALAPFSYGFKLLLFGDSVDRCTTEDWCYHDRPKPQSKKSCPDCYYWVQNTNNRYDALACMYGPDSISYVHLYGSSPSGPYFTHLGGVGPQDYTTSRIATAIDLYVDKMGLPDMILLQTVQWDVQKWYELANSTDASDRKAYGIRHSGPWNESLAIFEKDMNDRITDIQNRIAYNIERKKIIYPSPVNLGLRTGVWMLRGGALVHAFNDVVRRLSRERGLTLYDMDSDVWGVVHWNYSLQDQLLRDVVHPLPYYTARSGQKMFGRIYTSNIIIRGNISSSWPVPWIGEGPKPEDVSEVSLVSTVKNILKHEGDHHVFYLHKNPYPSIKPPFEKIGPLTATMRSILRFAPGDIYNISHEQVEKIPKSNRNFPPLDHENDKDFGVNTTNGHLYLYDTSEKIFRKAPNAETLSIFNISHAEITQNVEDTWLSENFQLGFDLPNIYREGGLVRWSGAKDCYVVQGGKLHSVPNANVFFKYGWDFSDVVVVTDIKDLQRLPMGDPVT